MNLKRKFRWEPAWQSYVPDGYEKPLEPLGEGPLAPEVESPRDGDPLAGIREQFARMSISEREAQGPGRCHLHPKDCRCYWCETAAERTADRLQAKALRERYGWG